MWAGKVHDQSVWASLIAPLRNRALLMEHNHRQCELVWEGFSCKTGLVPFGGVLHMFVAFLNATDRRHRWPKLD